MKINKFIFLLLFFVFSGPALSGYPESKDEYINDFANIIDAAEKQEIRKILYDTEYYSGIKIVVVTINYFSEYNTGSNTWEEFSKGLFNNWGIGNRPENNGVLILVSKLDRKIKIQLGAGYSPHYDSMMEEVIDNYMVPFFLLDKYSEGIKIGVKAVINRVTADVSFFEWWKGYIIAGIDNFMSSDISLIIDDMENVPLSWIFIVLAGILILFILRSLAIGESYEEYGVDDSSDERE